MSWDYVDGQGLWQRYKNSVTSEESIKEHQPKVIKQWCKQHRIVGNIPASRIVECAVCGQEIKYVVGYHDIKDGFLTLRNPSKQ